MRKVEPRSTEPKRFQRRLWERVECMPSCISNTNAFKAKAVPTIPRAASHIRDAVQLEIVSQTLPKPSEPKQQNSKIRLRQSNRAINASSVSIPRAKAFLAPSVASRAAHSADSPGRDQNSAKNTAEPRAEP